MIISTNSDTAFEQRYEAAACASLAAVEVRKVIEFALALGDNRLLSYASAVLRDLDAMPTMICEARATNARISKPSEAAK